MTRKYHSPQRHPTIGYNVTRSSSTRQGSRDQATSLGKVCRRSSKQTAAVGPRVRFQSPARLNPASWYMAEIGQRSAVYCRIAFDDGGCLLVFELMCLFDKGVFASRVTLGKHRLVVRVSDDFFLEPLESLGAFSVQQWYIHVHKFHQAISNMLGPGSHVIGGE